MKRFASFYTLFLLVSFLLFLAPAAGASAAPAAIRGRDASYPGSIDLSTRPADCSPAITVQNADDAGPGSLRQALVDVCAGGAIDFGGDYTITLAGQLTIAKSVRIDGTGHNIAVSGDTDGDGSGNVRVFYVNAGIQVTLDHLTVTKGATPSGGDYCPDYCGGGVYNAGTLTVTNSIFSGNSAVHGGGLENSYGTVHVIGSTFSGNTASSFGGAFNCSLGSTTYMVDSTLSGNYAYAGGGAVGNGGALTVINSTWFGNSAAGGGGLFNISDGSVTMIHSTVSGNSAGTSGGGGIRNSGTVAVRNSIVAGNTSPTYPNCNGTIGGSNNLADDNTCGPSFTNSPTILLGTLGDYGGKTATMPLLPGSAAIGATGSDCQATDQRGVARGTTCDIGAFESRGFTLGNPTGTPQSAVVNTAFAQPLGLTVSSAYGEPVNGGRVTFTAPGSGASATLAGNPATISGGAASVNATANGTAGSYTVTAGMAGVSGSALYQLQNIPAPDTAITDQPDNPSNSATASFSFTGTNGIPPLTFECRLDGGGWSSCTSPKSYNGLADGSHTFQVRSSDSMGNRDSSPAGYSWVIDTVPPNTTITGQPVNPSPSVDASFSFDGSDTGGTGIARFECRLDDSGWTTCTSPKQYGNLALAGHTFEVRAVDRVDNVDPTPATYTWDVYGRADLALHQAGWPLVAAPGQPITYTLVLSSAGPQLARGVILTDALPAQLADFDYRSSPGLVVTETGGIPYRWQVQPLVSGTVGTITITGVLSGCLAGGAHVDNSAAISAGLTFEADPGNNQSFARLTVLNVPPVAWGESYTTAEDAPLLAPAPGVLGNDTDGNCDPLTALLQSGPGHGVLVLNPDGSFVYTPTLNWNGGDTFAYVVSDGALTDTATVTLAVTAVNDAPVAGNDAYTATEDIPLAIPTPGVLADDSDPDGDPLAALLLSDPVHGALALAPDGSFVYTPTLNWNGADSFTYAASDGLLTGTATVTLTVTAVNDPPGAGDDLYSTLEDTPLTVPAPGVLTNDTDVDGDPLESTLGSPPANGTVTLALDGSFAYTSTVGYVGVDTFTYVVSDGFLTGTALVVIDVGGVDDPPIAQDDAYSTTSGTPLVVAAPGVLENDSDPEGQPLTARVVTAPTSGTLLLDSDGSFVYTPTVGFSGVVTFTYQAGDGTLLSQPALVTITVRPPAGWRVYLPVVVKGRAR